ncbi:nitrite/sulfite reductase [Halovivax gelatinilyticus]|uniref:nitrite/sulfite reductase n=1 Tax=Halovivax gelatinilyticus TaxID=2961597 RepID=UPI0020CA94FB|nr:ferredoxin--nitrite reductase [Halovivax gelatinilyticus]
MNASERQKLEKHPLDVIDDVYEYAADGCSFAEIEARGGEGEWQRLKWAGMYAQKQAGYFMMRTKVPGGHLTPEQAAVIGEVASEFATAPEKFGGSEQNELWGDAYLDITTRQDVQMHWIRIEDVPEIWERYEAVGLTTVQGCGDSARNVLGCPAAGLDDHECFDAQPVVDAVSEYFTGNRAYANLPKKFKLTITGCTCDCAQSQINDLGLVPATTDLDGQAIYGFHARVGGGLSDGPRMASELDVFVRPEDAVEFCRAVAQTYKELGDRNNRGLCRLRYLVEQLGPETFERAVRDRCTVDLPPAGEGLTVGYRGDHVGVHAQKQAGLAYVGFNVVAGRMGGDEFTAAARAAREYGTDEASIRLATDQNFLLTHVPDAHVDDLLDEPFAREYRPDPGPFSRGAVGCTGDEFCNYALVETKRRTKRWARALDERIDVPDDVEVIRMHISGCSASCAQPQIADIGFRGETVALDTDGDGVEDEIVEGMDVGLGGSLGADNAFLDWIETAVPADAVVPALAELFDAYAAERRDGEPFYRWARRVENDRLREIARRGDAAVAEGVSAGD